MFTRQQWVYLRALEAGIKTRMVSPDATATLVPDTGDGYLRDFFIVWSGVEGEAERVVEAMETDDLYHFVGEGILSRFGRNRYRLNRQRLAEVLHSNN